MMGLIIVLVYVTCGVLATGWTYGYFQGRYPKSYADSDNDRVFAIAMGVMGPIGLMTVAFNGGWKHGWKWVGK